MPRAETRFALVAVLLAAGAAAVVLATRGESAPSPAPSPPAQRWRAVFGTHPPAALPGRAIVVLRTPSLARRVAAARGDVTAAQERAWMRAAFSAQGRLLARLAARGVVIHPYLRFARVLDGFSAGVPASVVPLVERDPDVAGVYPVRAAYPASVSARVPDAVGVVSPLAASGIDGHGVTVAVLGGGASLAAVIARVAPGASIVLLHLPGGGATGDGVIAGLDRAVARDGARIALVALAEPFAGFPDSPEARAVASARSLGVLVVAPSGNDGPAGTVSGPCGAPAALTVGALDTRVRIRRTHVVVRAGLRTLFDAVEPLAGAAAVRPLHLLVAAPGALFTPAGGSTVAGRAALVRASPQAAVEAGASAVLLDGGIAAAAGGAVRVPVVSLPPGVARAVRTQLGRGAAVTVALGPASLQGGVGGVAPFSSTGPAFGGGVKPDLVAPGVAVRSRGGLAASGTAAAAAVVAGDAALLAQARPALGPAALAGLLVGTARPLAGIPVAAQGAGAVDLGAAAAGELAASPATLAPARTATFTLENLSSRRLSVSLRLRARTRARVALRPHAVVLPPGGSVPVRLRTRAALPAGGAVVATVAGGGTVRVPWTLAPPRPSRLLGAVSLSASGRRLAVTAGSVDGGGVEPVRALDLELLTRAGRSLGRLATLRDLLPGRYTFALTGRAPDGSVLAPGAYTVEVRAYPVGGGQPSVRRLRLAVR